MLKVWRGAGKTLEQGRESEDVSLERALKALQEFGIQDNAVTSAVLGKATWLVQWGGYTGTAVPGGTLLVPFKNAFPGSTIPTVVAWGTRALTVNGTPTASGFTVNSTPSQPVTVYFIAIGW